MDIDIQITLGDLLKFHNMKETRGGKRKNSGAKPKGNVQYQRRIKPELVPLMDDYLNKLKENKL